MNPADVANTILKMAKKRAQIDMTLTATAASDVFEQDLEDLTDEVRENVVNGKTQPASKASTVTPAKKEGEAPPSGPAVLVTDVIKKEGKKKDGTPYTKYTIKTNQGDYNTFSETFSKLAIDAKAAGAPVIVTFKTGQYGNDLESIALEVKEKTADPIKEDHQTLITGYLDKLGCVGDEIRLNYCGLILGHEIKDIASLTAEEVDKLAEELRKKVEGAQS
jgi:hypothetical protein